MLHRRFVRFLVPLRPKNGLFQNLPLFEPKDFSVLRKYLDVTRLMAVTWHVTICFRPKFCIFEGRFGKFSQTFGGGR